MNRNTASTILMALALAACSRDDTASETMTIEYPETARIEHTDSYHGTVVADPYRWLEDDVRESEAVRAWVDRQNDTTFAYLSSIEEREAIRKRLEELWNYERYG
ncbi:MAG: S9 family peptidase, partial [Steroidobacteraceae bacterium]